MMTGRNDTLDELKDHLFDKHPEELKQWLLIIDHA